MGSLALAAAGAVGGLGAGITEVGQQEQKKQMMQKESDLATARQETIARLQDKFQKENIQNEQQFSMKGAAAGRVFQEQQQTQKLTSEETRAKQHETEATGRANILANARRDVAGTNAAARTASAKQVPEFTHKTLNTQGSIDPVSHLPVPGRSYDVLNHKSGQGFVAVGDMYLPYEANATQFPDPKSIARAPADKLSLLADHPEKTMDFFQKYGYIPRNAIVAMQQQNKPNDPSLPKFLPPGTTAGAETPIGGPAEDQEDENAAEGASDPYGTQGLHPTTSPEDTQPAQ